MKQWMWIAVGLFIVNVGAFGAVTEESKESSKNEINTIKKEAEKERENMVDPYAKRFGLQAGLSIANTTVSSSVDSSNRAGFAGGLILEVPMLPGFLYVQPGLSFVQTGATNSVFGKEVSVRTNYIQIPLLAKIKLSAPHFKPQVFAGPTFAYLLSSSLDPVLTPASPAFNNFQYGFALGLGFTLPMGDSPSASEILFQGIYSQALNDTFSQTSWKSHSFMLQLGILL